MASLGDLSGSGTSIGGSYSSLTTQADVLIYRQMEKDMKAAEKAKKLALKEAKKMAQKKTEASGVDANSKVDIQTRDCEEEHGEASRRETQLGKEGKWSGGKGLLGRMLGRTKEKDVVR